MANLLLRSFRAIKSPYKIVYWLYRKGFGRLFSDKALLASRFRMQVGYQLDWNKPKTFNEKLNWLKLYYRKPEFTLMVDKYGVKKLVSEKIGEEYLIPTLGTWNHFDEIDFDSLPDEFVLKCTHDSGSTLVCRDKALFERAEAKKKIESWLKRNFYYVGREWPYKNVKPRIIAEELVKDRNYENLPVYKFMCFGGEPRIIQTIQNDKTKDESVDYFDTKWNLLNIRQNFPNSKVPFEKPACLEKMLEIARVLAEGLPFIRIDLYVINDEIKFSEYTFYSDCGFAAFTPEEWDEKLGSWIQLPKKYD